MKKRLLFVVLLIVLGATAYYRYTRESTSVRGAVALAPVTTGPLVRTVEAVGTLQPLRIVRVGAQVSGEITKLNVDFNSVVKQDEILAEIDSAPYDMQVAIQQANIARQENDLASQRVQLANEQRNLERAKEAYSQDLISLQELENTQLAVKTRASQIDSAEKTKLQAEAQLEQAKLNVQYCTIRSPIDGVVVARLVDVGQSIQSRVNAPQLFLLATELSSLRLQAGVDEADIGQIRPGMPVTFTVPSYRGRTFTGHVESVRLNAQIAENVVTYPVWITADNPDLVLRPSMTANLQISVDSVDNATLVSNDALRFRPNANIYAWLQLPAPAAGQRPVVRLAADQGAPVVEADDDAAAEHKAARASATKIDDLFAPIPKRTDVAQVWAYDENEPDPTRRLRQIVVRAGISDGTRTQIVSGDLKPGMQLLTGVAPPAWWLQQQSGSLFGQPQRGFGGMVQGQAPEPPRLNRGGPRGGRPRGGG